MTTATLTREELMLPVASSEAIRVYADTLRQIKIHLNQARETLIANPRDIMNLCVAVEHIYAASGHCERYRKEYESCPGCGPLVILMRELVAREVKGITDNLTEYSGGKR